MLVPESCAMVDAGHDGTIPIDRDRHRMRVALARLAGNSHQTREGGLDFVYELDDASYDLAGEVLVALRQVNI